MGMKKLGIASFTARGKSVADKLAGAFEGEYEITRYEAGLRAWCASLFASGADGIIFVGACGIAVRSIAPFLKSKMTDPAVLVIDEAGQFVISLLSGHIGGANRLAILAAQILGATPVITTATDVNGKFAVDVFAKDNGLRIGSMKAAKEISAAILRGEKVGVCCEGEIEGNIPPELVLLETGECQEKYSAPPEHGNVSERRNDLTDMTDLEESDRGLLVKTAVYIGVPVHASSIGVLSHSFPNGLSSQDSHTEAFSHSPVTGVQTVLQLCPRSYILGIGCRRGKTEQEIAKLAERSLAGLGLTYEDIVGVASIDLKKEEPGLVDFCKRHGLRFGTYSAEALTAVRGAVSHSAFVNEVTGVDNVCERAALCMAEEGGRLLLPKQAENGVTVAVAQRQWKVCF
ncbi:MAG: cobalamin biosynthesis protein [Lachnospiraceae bacterium]|nr:cobalamin biosynthesis protein [Lachnospiraceae bacterium]